jgi:hypothetical protein
MNSKVTKDLKVRSKSIRIIKDNKSSWSWLRQFLRFDPKRTNNKTETTKKNANWVSSKLNFLYFKGHHQRWESNMQNGQKCLQVM